ncbi:MAG: ribonuclease J [Desulfovibrionaceae bacterium]|nr:ribonuclease J [Desulfovibrionaceae bacterium]
MAAPFQMTITPLGGLGEIGLNCQLWDSPEGAVLIDCGLMFPDELQMGIDLVIPPMEPILACKDRLLGVILTHGHEDHIGAVPWLATFVKGLTVYGSPFTLELVAHKLRERALQDSMALQAVSASHDLQLGPYTFRFIPVSHSIPQCFAVAAATPVGKIVHTGDFKIDPHPADGVGTDLAALRKFAGRAGVRMLMCDSTNAEEEGHTLSETVVAQNFETIFSEAKGRIIITTFSSHIERIQQIFDTAERFGRAVIVSGRSLIGNIERARDVLNMRFPQEFYTDQYLPDIPPEKTVVLVTGSQGEPLSALARIVMGEHRQLKIQPGDTMIMSSRVIPGNAQAVNRLVNQMYRMGANVYHDDQHPVHVSGHARRDEIRALIAAANPRFFVPVHGEYRHLVCNRALAVECGVTPERALILEDGMPLTLMQRSVRLEEKIAAEPILVDGKGVGDVGGLVLRERQLMANDGVVVMVLVRNAENGEIRYGPEIRSKGFVFEQEYQHILDDARCLVLEVLETEPLHDIPHLSEKIRSAMRAFFRKAVGRDPVVVPVIAEL